MLLTFFMIKGGRVQKLLQGKKGEETDQAT